MRRAGGPELRPVHMSLLPHLDMGSLTAHVVPLSEYRRAWESVRERTHLKTLLEVDALLNESVASAGVELAAQRR